MFRYILYIWFMIFLPAISRLLVPISLIIGFFTFTSTSCEKPGDEENYPTYYLSDTIKAYNDFRAGSYWIYQDSITKEIDSSFIFSRIRTIDFSEFLLDNTEGVNIQQLIKGDTVYIFTSINTSYDYEYTSQAHVKNGYSQGDFNYFVSKKSPLTDGQIVNELKPTVYEGLTLSNGNQYSNVVAFTYVDDQQIGIYDEGNFFRTCYFAKHIGMVKIEFKDGTVFELLRHQVIQ